MRQYGSVTRIVKALTMTAPSSVSLVCLIRGRARYPFFGSNCTLVGFIMTAWALYSSLDARGAIAPPKADRKTASHAISPSIAGVISSENFFCTSPQAFPPRCACWNLKPTPLARIAHDTTGQTGVFRHDQPRRSRHGAEMNVNGP